MVKSSPSDRATASRVTFQLLIEGADQTVRISTPYFLPDRSLRRALVEHRRRGVKITRHRAGARTDQQWVRLASRRMWGELLEAGIRIFEYRPAMIARQGPDRRRPLVRCSARPTSTIDRSSTTTRSTSRCATPAVAARLLQDYERDLADSDEVTLDAWKRRPLWEKIVGPFVWILERQQ